MSGAARALLGMAVSAATITGGMMLFGFGFSQAVVAGIVCLIIWGLFPPASQSR